MKLKITVSVKKYSCLPFAYCIFVFACVRPLNKILGTPLGTEEQPSPLFGAPIWSWTCRLKTRRTSHPCSREQNSKIVRCTVRMIRSYLPHRGLVLSQGRRRDRSVWTEQKWQNATSFRDVIRVWKRWKPTSSPARTITSSSACRRRTRSAASSSST